jgi:hypothetical protein
MTKEYNAYEVVQAAVEASAVSRRLSKVRDRSEKAGFGRAWRESPRTTGFRATQSHPYQVEVWWRAAPGDDPSVAQEAYAAMTEDLEGAGYSVARHPGPGLSEGALLVSRKREPTDDEWTALEKVAPHPIDCTHEGVADGVPVTAVGPLIRSGLLAQVAYPLVRHHAWQPHVGFLLALGNEGRKLLEARIKHERYLRDARVVGITVD